MDTEYVTIGDIIERKLLPFIDKQGKAIRKLIKSGELPASKIGRRWIIKTEDLKAYIESKKYL